MKDLEAELAADGFVLGEGPRWNESISFRAAEGADELFGG